MTKQVLNVGQCAFDHASITRLLAQQFSAHVISADGLADAIALLHEGPWDLVLVNRQLDADGSDGLDVIRRIKSDTQLAKIPVMLVSNYPEYQQEATAAGAEPGFGKRDLAAPATRERLANFLS
jgi:CheY-like chemotaxis protein